MKTLKSNAGRKPIPDKKIQIGVCTPKSRVELLGKSYIQEKCNELIEELYIMKGGANV
jgi:hypothetical protein